jgi:hypothetical protein
MIGYETFHKLLPPARLRALAITHKVDACNQIRLPGATVFTCLLHGLLHHPDLTQRLLEEAYEQQTGQRADHSSFGKRLAKISPKYFRAIYQHLRQQLAPTVPAAQQHRLRLRFVDATLVSLSAKLLSFGLLQRTSRPGHSLRLVKSVFELREDGLPEFLHLCRTPSEKSDCVALGDPMIAASQPGDLWVFDAGCHDRHRLLRLHRLRAYWITPHSQQALRIRRVLFASPPPGPPQEPPKKGEPTFVLEQVASCVFGNAQETSTEQAQWESMPLLVIRGWRFDTRRKVWALLQIMTNLPLSADEQQAGGFTFLEVAQIYRDRWGLESFFKLVKQYISFDHLLSRCENGIEVMMYMTLILTWLLMWYQRQTKIDRGWRSVASWLAHDVQSWVQVALRKVQVMPVQPLPKDAYANST